MNKYFLLSTILFLAACQTETANTNYVSIEQYQDYNCKQISREMQRISRKLDASTTKEQATTNAVLDSAIKIYGMSQGYAFYEDDSNNSESARLAATYDALEQLSIQKNCEVK